MLLPAAPELRELGVALLVHPGPGRSVHGVAGGAIGATALDEPLWWPALTGYVAQMQAAWFAFASAGRPAHPQLRVIFTMLGGPGSLMLPPVCHKGQPLCPRSGFPGPGGRWPGASENTLRPFDSISFQRYKWKDR